MAGKIGIIGGSGFYNIEGIKKIKTVRVKTPFGDPSSGYVTGVLEGSEVVFLARHDKGHRILPSEINYRANIYGMKKLGVERMHIAIRALVQLVERDAVMNPSLDTLERLVGLIPHLVRAVHCLRG